jgi:TonB-dependent receptor
VLIRGLPNVQTLLNGRQIFTANDRAISLPDFPSELLAQVDVHKASSATDLEGGIAGLINVRLRRPFDFDGPEIAGTAQMGYSTLATVPSENASVLLSDRWNTDVGEVGLLFDASYRQTFTRENQSKADNRAGRTAGPVPGAGSGPAPVCTTGCRSNNMTYAGGVQAGYAARFRDVIYQNNGKVERAALDLSGQWKPTADLQAFMEVFYTRLRNSVNADVFVGQDGACDNSARDTVFPGTNLLQEEYAGCFAITSNQPQHSKEDTWQAATGADWNVTDNFKLSTEFSATVSKDASRTPVLDDYFNYNSPDAMHAFVSWQGSGIDRIEIPGNEQINGPFYYSQFYDNWNEGHGNAWDGRIDATYSFGAGDFIRDIQAGFRYNRRGARNIAPAGGGLGCAAITTNGNPAAANNKYIVAAYNSPACTAFRAATTPSVAAANNPLNQTNVHIGGLTIPAADLHCTHGDLFGEEYGITKFCDAATDYLYNNTEEIRNLFGYSGQPEASPANSYNIAEATNGTYLKVDFAIPMFGFVVDGNVGARYVTTDLTVDSSSSQYVPNGQTDCLTCVVYTPVHATKETGDFMPSVNLRATLEDGIILRFGASKTVTRPTFTQLNPNYVLRAPTGNLPGSISGGNPNLSSVKSVNLDLDGEYYWGAGNANHVSLAVFHRDISGYIQNQTQQVFVDGQPYNQTLPINFQDATLEGAEAAYSQFLDFLPGFWSGFGWDVNASYIAGVFQNISHWHANATGVYEKGPWSFRLSWTWSSKYLVGNRPGVQPNTDYAAPRNNLDFSFNYALGDGLTLTLDATNIMNSHYREFAWQPGDSVEQDMNYYAAWARAFDRTVSIGLRYRMGD